MKRNLDKDYDIIKFISLFRNSHSYDEFKVKCDMNLIECIISKDEFDDMHILNHNSTYEHKMTVL